MFPPAPYRSGSHDTYSFRLQDSKMRNIIIIIQTKLLIVPKYNESINYFKKILSSNLILVSTEGKHMGKTKLIPILAVIILLVGIGSSIYVNSTKIDSQQITVNGKKHNIDQLFEISEKRSLEAEFGIALDKLIVVNGVTNPEMFEYTIIGADGYQKTVT